MKEDFDRGAKETPFSRPLTVADIPPEGLEVEIRANAAERAALAQINGLPALPSLTARLRLTRAGAEGLDVAGELRAEARQSCVVTLEDFDVSIVEPLHLRFEPPRAPPRPARGKSRRRPHDEDFEAAADHRSTAADDDRPDPLIGGAIDLGAIVSEFLALALDPYPRKPGASFVELAPEQEPAAVSPFAKLRAAAANRRRNNA
jgi:hypothetical protein